MTWEYTRFHCEQHISFVLAIHPHFHSTFIRQGRSKGFAPSFFRRTESGTNVRVPTIFVVQVSHTHMVPVAFAFTAPFFSVIHSTAQHNTAQPQPHSFIHCKFWIIPASIWPQRPRIFGSPNGMI